MYEFFDMFDYTRRMGLTTDIFSFLFKVESQLKYHDLELDESYKAVRDFNSCDEIVLYVKTRQNMLFSQKKRKEEQTNKPQW